MDLTVSIVNWNTRDELRECLDTVLQQECPGGIDVVVVDNASDDGSVDMLTSDFGDRLRVAANSANLGFGAGHNPAIRTSAGRYVLLLNPDCRMLEPDMCSQMVTYMDAHPDVGILGPRVLNPDGSLQFSARHYPTLLAGAFRHTVFGKLFPKNRFVREYLMTDWPHDVERDVDWVSGSAMLLRREMLDKIGLLDERFFMYCEDIDICRRAHDSGWMVVYYPMVQVTHRIGAASSLRPIPMIKQHHKSMLRYFIKYNSGSPRILLVPLVMLALAFRCRSLIRVARRAEGESGQL